MKYLAEVILRYRKPVLAGALLLALLGGVASATLFGKLSSGGFYRTDGEANRAAAVLEQTFGERPPNLTLLVETPSGVDDPRAAAQGEQIGTRLAAESGVANVVSYWTSHAPQLRSQDGKQAVILATIEGDESAVAGRLNDLAPAYVSEQDGVRVEVGGNAMFQKEMNEQGQEDATRGEMIAFPITLIVLVLVFGSVVAATMPLLVALVATLVQLGVLWVLASLTDLSVFAISVASLLGLGLAIDYSLLVVNRYREEIHAGRDVSDAIRVVMTSAGRTAVFSAIIVSFCLASLVWIPLGAVRSIAYSGIATALLSAGAAVTVLPAVLALLGRRIESGRVLKRSITVGDNGFWHRLATFVMRRPIPIALAVAAVLVLLGLPALSIKLGMPDERIMGESSAARQVATEIRENFDAGEQNAVPVVVPETGGRTGDVAVYAAQLSQLPDVARVDSPAGSYADGARVAEGAAFERFARGDSAYYSVVPDPGVGASTGLVEDLRAAPSPFPVLVGGAAAMNVDTTEVLQQKIPLVLLTVGVTMVIVLFLLTSSVVLPFLALLLSSLSITAAFGALVWIFQDGHLASLLGFTPTGTTVSTIPVMLFALAFGLAMDYQVFMLSRIREEYERTGSTTEAVASGLARIGRIVTAAAVLISLVFLAFLVSDISMVKAYGLGLPLVVLMDATLIRGALLPATMQISRNFVWWAPGPLRRLYGRIGFHEGESVRSEPGGEAAAAERAGAR
ncbi:MMPL family transporter [Nocardia mexicana]|uniref:RND superfamily putative drug exporter n=1 Tax=Nocardia mexicana TaxID=279262 RepID=A0A370H2W6_9NOCA|nr:MMPL family transporter [Nocardia mexicana]RDI49994.1 RND superfamily putative drug exporter [Nocardia mexicana]